MGPGAHPQQPGGGPLPPRMRVKQVRCGKLSQTAKGASGKGPRQKTSKIVKKCLKTIFDTFRVRAGQKNVNNRSVKNIFDTFRQISRGTSFPAPLGGL